MKMNFSFASRLMNDFVMLAIMANGRIPETAEEVAETEKYARNTFLALTDFWEEEMGEKWEVELDDDDEEEVEFDNPNCPKDVGTLEKDDDGCVHISCDETSQEEKDCWARFVQAAKDYQSKYGDIILNITDDEANTCEEYYFETTDGWDKYTGIILF